MNDGTNITITDYLDGFQYNQQVLEFFPHAEGYVKATPTGLVPPGTPPSTYAFNYVFNYTDHLGNVRVSYTKDPQTGNLKILDESHYYPFGLKHQEYSTFGFVSNPIQGVIIAPIANNPYKYKYQGQERQDELGLNWDSFKWRNYDYAIGRFMSIDPLAEKYSDYTPYQFSSNQVVHAPEIEGLENSADLNQKTLQEQHLKGEISNEVLMDNYEAQFNGAVTGISIILPGEELVVGTLVKWGTKIGTSGKIGKIFNNLFSKGNKTSTASGGAKKVEARTDPKDLKEKLTLDEAKSGQGEKIMEGKLKDKKYDPETGTHDKVKHNHDHGDGTSTEVHYDRSRETGEGSGYKIKDDTNANSRGHRYP